MSKKKNSIKRLIKKLDEYSTYNDVGMNIGLPTKMKLLHLLNVGVITDYDYKIAADGIKLYAKEQQDRAKRLWQGVVRNSKYGMLTENKYDAKLDTMSYDERKAAQAILNSKWNTVHVRRVKSSENNKDDGGITMNKKCISNPNINETNTDKVPAGKNPTVIMMQELFKNGSCGFRIAQSRRSAKTLQSFSRVFAALPSDFQIAYGNVVSGETYTTIFDKIQLSVLLTAGHNLLKAADLIVMYSPDSISNQMEDRGDHMYAIFKCAAAKAIKSNNVVELRRAIIKFFINTASVISGALDELEILMCASGTSTLREAIGYVIRTVYDSLYQLYDSEDIRKEDSTINLASPFGYNHDLSTNGDCDY